MHLRPLQVLQPETVLRRSKAVGTVVGHLFGNRLVRKDGLHGKACILNGREGCGSRTD